MSTIHKVVTGISALAANGDVDKTVIIAQGAGTKLRLVTVVITVNVIASGTNGVAALEDGAGGTRLLEVNAGTLGTTVVQYGDEGPVLSADTLLNLTVDTAATTQASAKASAVCKVLGA